MNSLGGPRYFGHIYCRLYKFSETLMLSKRYFQCLLNYKIRIVKEMGKFFKQLRTDNANEYMFKEFTHFLEREGFRSQHMVKYTRQQNASHRLIERVKRTLVEMLLIQGQLSQSFWGKSNYMANFLRNSCPSLNDVTPIEWTKKTVRRILQNHKKIE